MGSKSEGKCCRRKTKSSRPHREVAAEGKEGTKEGTAEEQEEGTKEEEGEEDTR